MAVSNIIQQITVENLVSTPGAGTAWVTGTSKAARKIGEQNLPADYTLTQIQVTCNAITGASGANPAIIRVYQYGREAAAATMEITGTGIHLQPINITITTRYGSDRKVIIDAWDPDPTSPNNTCSITGLVAITGRPASTATGGATQFV